MDVNFCRHWIGNGIPPNNKYCRICPQSHLACDALWNSLRQLANSNNGAPVVIPGTATVLLPNNRNQNIVYIKVNSKWNLPKEDFLHFIATGFAKGGHRRQRGDLDKSPSLSRQQKHLMPIVITLGGTNNPLIIAARNVF